jgi:hypothetical protein
VLQTLHNNLQYLHQNTAAILTLNDEKQTSPLHYKWHWSCIFRMLCSVTQLSADHTRWCNLVTSYHTHYAVFGQVTELKTPRIMIFHAFSISRRANNIMLYIHSYLAFRSLATFQNMRLAAWLNYFQAGHYKWHKGLLIWSPLSDMYYIFSVTVYLHYFL